MFCNHCGAKLPEGTRFCMNCGSAVQQIQPPTPRPASQQRRVKQLKEKPVQNQHSRELPLIPILIGVFVLLAAILGVLLFLLLRDTSDPESDIAATMDHLVFSGTMFEDTESTASSDTWDSLHWRPDENVVIVTDEDLISTDDPDSHSDQALSSEKSFYLMNTDEEPLVGLTGKNNELGDLILSHTTYEVVKIDKKAGKDKDHASVTLNVTAPHALDIVRKSIDQSSDDLTRKAAMQQIIKSGEYSMIDFEVHTTAIRKNDHWYLVLNDELANALSGGALSQLQDINDTYRNQLEEEGK